jgi:hypothetical protein
MTSLRYGLTCNGRLNWHIDLCVDSCSARVDTAFEGRTGAYIYQRLFNDIEMWYIGYTIMNL